MMDRGTNNRFRSGNGDSSGLRGRLTILVVAVLVMALASAGGEALLAELRYERAALAAGQWWRLIGAHVVHLDLRHLLFNVAGLVLLWMLFAREYRLPQWLAILLCTMLAVDAGLWFGSPHVIWYVGASGALHGLWSAGGWAQWRRAVPVSVLPLLALLLKLVVEQWRGGSVLVGDMQVVLQAHVYGALGGLILPVAWQLAGSRRARPL
jgi:rhomboid family GlyGly-CTERM serine protease